MSSPVGKHLDPNDIDEVMGGSIKLVKRLMKHAQENSIVSVKDVREIRSTAKLCIEVMDKATTDPFFMAHIVKNMSKERLSALNEWIHQTRRLGK